MDSVVHFELPAENRERVRKFYEQAFGWKMNQLGPEMGNYILASTVETDENQMPTKVGAINGGIYEKSKPEDGARLTIDVQDIKEALKKIEEAGGKVIGGMQNPPEPDNIPGVGIYALFVDTEGNIGSVMQSTREEGK